MILKTNKGKKAQEEMVGFAVILVIVSVILLVVLGFSLKKTNKSNLGDYEVESFIEAGLQYTTNCENYLGFMSVQEAIISCEGENSCIDERDSCEVLNSTLNELITQSWNVGEENPVKGYKLQVKAEGEEKLTFIEGNETSSYKGSFQDFTRKGKDYEVSLVLYS